MPPAKKASKRATGKTATTAAAEKPAAAAKERAEFLVVTVPDTAKEGSALKILYVAPSLDEAKAHVDTLTGTSSRYFGILEKKLVLRRAPVMQTSKASRNILAK